MNKQQIKIIDTQFGHGKSFGTGDLQIPPKNFDWYRGNETINNLVVFAEDTMHLVDKYTEKNKVAFLLEAPCKKQHLYNLAADPSFYKKFKYILTYDRDLIKVNPNKIKFYPFGGCWIWDKDKKIHEKTKNVSIIASGKRDTFGQRLRHEVIRNFKKNLDGIYGRGYNPVHYKLDAFKNYRYSVIIENQSLCDMFSEKLIDCFMTGTIPIYYGCNGNIGNYFNTNGIIQFTNLSEFNKLIDILTIERYVNSIDAIKENLELAKQYTIPEDWMWDRYFKYLV
jgi:hypothetical protein